MRVDFILAAARAELLRTTRLSRTWLFALLATLIGVGLYQLGASLHLYQLVYHQPVPRFGLQGYGLLALAVLLFGTIFLAFDMRRRDVRARMADALDATPVTNLELLGGRCLGVALVVWLLLVGIFGLIQVIGLVAMVLDVAWLGEAVAPLPLFAFLTIDAVPLVVLWSALVVMLSSVLRSPLLAAAAALTLGGLYLWLIFNAPLYLLPSISGIANLGLPGSDILPRLPGAAEFVQRSALLMLAAAFLVVAAACDARTDSLRRGSQAAAGVGLLAAGSLVIGLLTLALAAERAEPLRWADRHAAIEHEQSPDVTRVSGRVDIEPGQRLTVDVVLTLRSPSAEPLATLTLSLNPGMRIAALQVDGKDAAYEHEAGILFVSPHVPVTGDTPVILSVRAVGVPDPGFGYLDSAVRATDEAVLGIPLVLLGDEASIYDEDFVALMPGVHWLPSSGANYGADDRAPDYRTVDLEVHAPAHWHIAGPGRSGGKGTWRFAPDVPVAKFALIAGAFERRTLGFDGANYELLIHPMHVDNLRRFDEPDGAFATWLKAEYLEPVVARGLDYPYGTFSLVEVPTRLRLRRRLAHGHVAGPTRGAASCRARIPDAPFQPRRRGRATMADDGPRPHGAEHDPCQCRRASQPAFLLDKGDRRRCRRPRCAPRDAHGPLGRPAPVEWIPRAGPSRPLGQSARAVRTAAARRAPWRFQPTPAAGHPEPLGSGLATTRTDSPYRGRPA
ncbi:MAG: hypothetical protein OXG82_13545 [Gammaproteobacteria bacterium]|nr:hypothetical protein [Gammaproteobacteria bacterium]